MVYAYVIVLSTHYYTDYEYKPVVGISVGMKVTLILMIAVAISVLAAYHLDGSRGIGSDRNTCLFGTAVVTMGMLLNTVYILSMNNSGPFADNAVESPRCPCSHNSSMKRPIA